MKLSPMKMTPGIRKFALTAPVTSSVGWLGAVGAFLALAISGLTTPDAQKMRAAYVAMELTGWTVIVPLSLASLLTGLVQSLGTTWGMFRHYWVVVKLVITVLATILLLVHMQIASRMAGTTSEAILSGDNFGRLRIQFVADAGAAMLVLLVATALSVFKPQGLTPYGRRQEQRLLSQRVYSDSGVEPGSGSGTSGPRWVRVFGIITIVLLALFLILHLTGGGLGGHTAQPH